VGFETHTRQHKLSAPTHDQRVILREAWALFVHGKLPRKPVRLIGLGISGWQRADSMQVDLFNQPELSERDERLLATLDRATDRFGKGILQLGCTTEIDKRKPR
jgi:DNA polymerase-4